jgi:hypothetical protein
MPSKIALILMLSASAALAGTITVDTTDRGYYYNYDFSDNTNKNYITGQLNVGSTVGFHSFFTFGPLSGLSGPIVSATLSLFNPVAGYSSSQSSETLVIDGFTGNVTTLDAGGTVSGEYNALAAGATFASQSVNAATDGAFINIALNSNAIAFLNANSGSTFAFGGYLSGIPVSDTSSRYVFGGSAFVVSNDGNTQLSVVTGLATPEPATWATLLLALPLFLLGRRIRRAFSAS